MGICSSCESTSVSKAKLILQDGRLEEFTKPIKVSEILEKNPKCFICNSDDVDFNNVLSAIDYGDELQPGELYFALPLTWRNCPLRAEQMGALAVKATLALTDCRRGGCVGGCGMNFKRVDPLLFTANDKVMEHSTPNVSIGSGGSGGGGTAYDGSSDGGLAVKRRGKGGPRGSDFRKLTAILEEVD